MNNTFNIHRFGLLLKRQWLEFGKIYLIILAVVLGILIAFYGYNYYILTVTHRSFSSPMAFTIPLFLTVGFLFITIIAGNYFTHLGQKPHAIIDLLTPASIFEKFIVGVVFSLFLGVIGYLLLFYVTDVIFITFLRKWFQTLNFVGPIEDINEVFPYFFEQQHEYLPLFIYLMPFFITSVFLLGSIYFNKFHYIKTAICVMIFSGIWIYIMVKTGQGLFEGKILVNNENRGFYNISSSTAEWLGVLLLVVLTLIFWLITYVRLKEKEV